MIDPTAACGRGIDHLLGVAVLLFVSVGNAAPHGGSTVAFAPSV